MKNHRRAKGRTKKARLKKRGWKFGSTATFLGLSREESDRLDIEVARRRLADPKEVPIPYERVADSGGSRSSLIRLSRGGYRLQH